jgi:hypothetical protein
VGNGGLAVPTTAGRCAPARGNAVGINIRSCG